MSASTVYLAIGFAPGMPVAGFVRIDLAHDAHALRVLTESALLVSLFAIGPRLGADLGNRLWRLPVRLGVVATMMIVPLPALASRRLPSLAWGSARLLAAILAPTDPVLAYDVPVRDPGDLDFARFELSTEGGVNDGIAMPFARPGLALHAHDRSQREPAPFTALRRSRCGALPAASSWAPHWDGCPRRRSPHCARATKRRPASKAFSRRD